MRRRDAGSVVAGGATAAATGAMAGAGVTRTRRRGPSLAARESLAAYAFILPSLVGFLVFLAGPVVASLGLSLYDWELLLPPRFIGLANYHALLQDPRFHQVVLNTAYYVVGVVPLNIVVALGLALWLNRSVRGITLYRSAFFVPVVTSTVAVSLIWMWMYSPNIGLINTALRWMGVHGPIWLGDTRWAMPALILLGVWKGFGYNMVVFLAGLQGIPVSLYEAAAIDGANPRQRFRYVTLPLLSPTTFLAVVLTMISSFQVFESAYVMTGGGPVNATNTIVLYIYQNGFQYFKMGYASALAWGLFAVIFTLTLAQMKLQRTWVHYE
jgi:multiple sugar transport system permease protein